MPPKGTDKEKNQHIQVAVRVRPLNATERKHGSYSIVDMDTAHKTVSVKSTLNQFTNNQKIFSYDNVFNQQTKQVEVYKTIVAPTLNEVLMGYNCTIFAYGQTGSGKTFTMEGERTENMDVSWEEDPLAGIIPRTLHHLFTRLQKQECEFSVRISFLEIYNEELIDLLGAETVENPRLKIYEDTSKKGSCVIQGLEEVVVHSKDEVYSILERGTNKRQTAATLLNAHSSRSHSVFMITVHIKENTLDGEELLKTGKLNLVDLAGSENIGRSGAVEKRAREAGNINQSLLTLGRCITALVEHAPHVPFRESKLTRLLQDSLGGRTKTSIIATISPASCNLEETISTLEYAHRAKSITNKPELNQKLTKRALIKEYTEEVERLRRDLQAARDKNGIYLASDNYQKMLTTDAAQKSTIRELEEKIEHVNTEMIKVSEMFSDTKLELTETKSELEQTARNLAETSDSLQDTRRRLRSTRQQRDEQAHLVTEHAAAEGQLYGQATQLLDTVGETKGDVGALHDKLERVRDTERHNDALQTSFMRDFHESMESMQSNLKEFTTQNTSINTLVRENLGEVVRRSGEAVESRLADIDRTVQQLSTGLQALTILENAHADNTQAARKQLQQRATLYQESSMKLLHAALACLTSDHSALQTLRTELRDHHTQTLTALESVERSVAGVDAATSECEQRVRAACKQYEQELRTQCEQQLSQQAALSSSQHTHDQELEAEAGRLEEEMLACVHKLRTLRQDKSCKRAALRDQQTDLVQQHTQALTQQVAHLVATTDNELSSMQESVHTHSAGLNDTCRTHTHASTQLTDKLENDILGIENEQTRKDNDCRSHIDATLQGVTSHCEGLAEHVVTQNNSADCQLQERLFSIQDAESGLVSGAENLSAALRRDAEEACAGVRAEREALAGSAEAFSHWSASTHGALDHRRTSLTNFITDQFLKLQPTGKTPERRDFSHPKKLTKTGRHSLLLQQFREQYRLNEGMNLPVPDFSFTESEVGGDTESVAESLDTSGDSAISTASTLSSHLADTQNKENAGMRPPTSRAPKNSSSRHARSGTSTSSKRDRSTSSTRSGGGGARTPGKALQSDAPTSTKTTPAAAQPVKRKIPMRVHNQS